MVWIAAIADEVVDVLNVSFTFFFFFLMSARYGLLIWNIKTLGEIVGLSDAIIGLTSKFPHDKFFSFFVLILMILQVFAVGNSLADLVANVIVAQFAPAMAYAACFGGP